MGVTPVGYAEITAVFDIPGDAGPANVVLGHEVGALTTLLEILDGATDVWTADPGIMDMITVDVILESINVRWQESAGDPVIGDRQLNEPGRTNDEAASPQICMLVQKITGLGGRKNRGRSYLPGTPQSVVAPSGLMSQGYYDTHVATIAAFFQQWAAADLEVRILHTSPADTPSEVVAMELVRKVATQRRRLR